MTREQILAAIPHRPPMLLLDEITESGNDTIVCGRTFSGEEFFFQGHFPDAPIVPGVILCEMALQAGAVLLARQYQEGRAEEGELPLATRLNNVKFKRMVRPGDTVQVAVQIRERLANAFFLSARLTCEEELTASLDFACTMAAR
ncbi:MAG: 3-hydroxyacyl-ACP dehydratase FabZ family protein [Pirellulaceae bacterium]|jgi:3-hydroxyacyl-[acyl-carrier-protein] dehydratase